MNLLTYLNNAFSYDDYLKKIEDQLFDLEKFGDEKGLAKYYSINLKRIKRLDKTFALTQLQKEKLDSLNAHFQLLIISEGWCGDAAQIMPVINKMMKHLGVEQKIVFRDQNPELMNAYLTNGAKSIPILIGVDDSGKELFHYGPRPEEGMRMLNLHKTNPEEYTSDQFHKDLQIWYNNNNGEAIFEEFFSTLKPIF